MMQRTALNKDGSIAHVAAIHERKLAPIGVPPFCSASLYLISKILTKTTYKCNTKCNSTFLKHSNRKGLEQNVHGFDSRLLHTRKT